MSVVFRSLAIAVSVLLLAACGGDNDSNGSDFSREQLEAWANELWQQVEDDVVAADDFCPEDPAESPKLSIAPLSNTNIPKEAQPAVGRLLAEKVYAYCRSASEAASFSDDQIQQWAEQLIASGGATVRCPSGTDMGVIQKPASAVGFDAGSDIPVEAQQAVAKRASEKLRDACEPTPQ